MRRTSQDGQLHYATREDALCDAPAGEREASGGDEWAGWEAWMRSHLVREREIIARAFGEILDAEQEKRDAEMAKLKNELSELRGRVDALLAILGKSADVVNLPRRSA
jgi:hypothetical protein